MAAIKRTLIIFWVIIGLIVLATSLLPSKISIVKSVDISGQGECAMNQVNDFNRWPEWLPLLKEGLATLRSVSGDDAVLNQRPGNTVELHYAIKTADSTLVTMTQPGANPVEMIFLFNQTKSGSKLHFIVNTKLRWYPWEKIGGIFVDKMMGGQYEEALKNIKSNCGE